MFVPCLHSDLAVASVSSTSISMASVCSVDGGSTPPKDNKMGPEPSVINGGTRGPYKWPFKW